MTNDPGPHRLAPGDRVVVIANPSTRADARLVREALEATVPDGVQMEIHWTDSPGAGRTLARRHVDRATCMVAVGGDGTVAEVASALVGTQMPLGVIPGGSTNIIAREQRIPTDLNQAARLLWDWHRIEMMDVGICNDQPFLHMAGAGFDSRLFSLADSRLKRKVGWLAYLPAAAKALRIPPAIYSIVADDEVIEAVSPLVLVANGRAIIAPGLTLSREIRSNDGWLDLIVVTATRPHQLAGVLGRLATLQFAKSRHVVHRRVRRVTIDASEAVPMQLDGDVAGHTPATFGILPGALRMVVPDR